MAARDAASLARMLSAVARLYSSRDGQDSGGTSSKADPWRVEQCRAPWPCALLLMRPMVASLAHRMLLAALREPGGGSEGAASSDLRAQSAAQSSAGSAEAAIHTARLVAGDLLEDDQGSGHTLYWPVSRP